MTSAAPRPAARQPITPPASSQPLFAADADGAVPGIDRPARLVSCGAGVQSTTILLLVRAGRLPRPDRVIFADTGWESRSVYAQVERLRELCVNELGVAFDIVRQGNLRTDALDPDHRFASVPYFVRNPDGSDGMGRRQCTAEYKLAPINRRVRALLGAPPPHFRRVPAGRRAEQWIGFSVDEIGRASGGRRPVSYLRPVYPLLELGMTRRDCERVLAKAGWGHTAKSACIGCPFHGNRQWRDLRDTRPDEWADAVAFDHAIRRGGGHGLPLHGEAFLHRARVPLERAPIDHVTSAEVRDRIREVQGDLLDLLDEEEGDPDGCSPYGCRSGHPLR